MDMSTTTTNCINSPQSKIDRCNSASSSASSGSSSSEQPSQQQERVKQSRQSTGKRFFVSRVHPQQLLAAAENDEHHHIEKPEVVGEKEEEEGEMVDEGEEEELISFRYTWPVRISERLIGADESAILNVSPPFCTAHNGVQFTWLVRICEENILDFGHHSNHSTLSHRFGGEFGEQEEEEEPFGRKKVNITLYYKEGPARDVKLRGGNISIRNCKGALFENMPLRELEYTKGGGWSPICAGLNSVSAGQRKFSEFIHQHIGKQIMVRIKLEMPASMFQPMQYLPSIDSPIGGKLEALCAKVLDEIRMNQLHVPDMEYFDPKTDKYALYRHVYQFACQEIFNRYSQQSSACAANDEPELMEKIRNIFAYHYFNTVIVREAECFEDFLEALDASRYIQFPALRRECERYICAEVMAESADLMLVKKMLLLAERFNLPVLKMVSFGVIVDRLLMQQEKEPTTNEGGGELMVGKNAMGGGCHSHHNFHRHQKSGDSGMTTIESSMEEIREELLEIAEQIIHPDHYHHPQPSSASSSNTNPHHLQVTAPHRVHSKSLSINSPKRLSTSSGSSADVEEEENGDSDDDEEEEVDAGGETLVGSVISQLEELARHIRKVSMPPGVRPAPQHNNGRPLSPELAPNHPKPIHSGTDSGNGSMDSRRSSLKTGRDILLQQHRQERSNSSGNGHGLGPLNGHFFFDKLYDADASSSSESVQQRSAANCPAGIVSGKKEEGGGVQFSRPFVGGHRPARKNGVASFDEGPAGKDCANFEEDEGVEEDHSVD